METESPISINLHIVVLLRTHVSVDATKIDDILDSIIIEIGHS
jgi:hypothetical protein